MNTLFVISIFVRDGVLCTKTFWKKVEADEAIRLLRRLGWKVTQVRYDETQVCWTAY